MILLFHQTIFAGSNDEFRATWVITWHHINPNWTAEQNKAQVRRILDNHKKANMNAVLWQARQSGTAYYNSSYEPWGYYAGYSYPGYDPLEYAIEEAHKRGLELHAWINIFHVSAFYPGTPAYEHQNWICRDRDGNPMKEHRCFSPGLDSVREYTINVAMEIVRNYDIDGLHLDYVRWNEYTTSKQSQEFAKLVEEERLLDGMITDAQIEDLIKNQENRYLYDIDHPYSAGVPTGFDTWEDWWRWTVTEFVRVLHDSIQAVKPWVRLSPAALGKYKAGGAGGWNGYHVVFQDAALWFNKGYVEQLTPMHYHWTTDSKFYDELKNDWEPYIQAGIDTGRLYSVGPGSYMLANYNVWGNHPEIVETCRSIPWVDGFQFFSYGSWRDYDYWQKAGETFFNRKTKIRDTKLIDSIPPDPPTISLTEIDSLTYQITVIPPITATYWYAIYRSTDSIIDVDNDGIIDVHFGDSSFTYIDSFDGTQDYNGVYSYAATTFDRYWNESEVSNLQQSDSIPSFAPTVIATTPAEGDTVSINIPIVIHFSKTMDTTSFGDTTITIAPEIGIFQLIWSDGSKTLTLEMSEYLEYNTQYTLTVAPSARDINGKSLDGDSDGIGGDAFILNFRTKARDDVPPEVVFTYPAPETDSFDVKDIITFVFDELIDPNTFDTNSVALYKSSIKIPIQFLHSAIDNKSVLNIQPEQPLEPNTEYTPLLGNTITDTAGNPMESYFTVNFRTSPEGYTETVMMEDFTYPGDWKQPSYSGSTQGVVIPNTEWGYTSAIYLPATSPRKSAYLRYEWDITASEWLLREYLAGGPPRAVIFDTTYILQCYIYGDGSNNKFRFCLDDSTMDQAAFHEVSQWITLNWYGWRLVEWKLNDPNSVGEWIGDGTLNPPLRFDSFQLTHEIGDSVRGEIYFDELRLVKKSFIGVEEREIPLTFRLF
ncbi:MAG: Ig-like domain-containing protein, partial [candidate division WOR-3 bacterium]|nr:Ig-like domain-containing protein [candidate division WOR-3 bacterium]